MTKCQHITEANRPSLNRGHSHPSFQLRCNVVQQEKYPDVNVLSVLIVLFRLFFGETLIKQLQWIFLAPYIAFNVFGIHQVVVSYGINDCESDLLPLPLSEARRLLWRVLVFEGRSTANHNSL